MPPVKMYTLSGCVHCKNTKQFLNENGVKYECIGNKMIVGFKRDEIKEALGI